MAHTTMVADQLIEFLQLINDPNKSKKLLDELKSINTEIKARQGLLEQKEDIEKYALRTKTDISKALDEIKKKQEKLDQDHQQHLKDKLALSLSMSDFQTKSGKLALEKEEFENMKRVWDVDQANTKKQLSIQEADLARMVKYNEGLTKTLEEKQEALKKLLG